MGDAEEKLKQLEAEARAAERKIADDEAAAERAQKNEEAEAARKRAEDGRTAPGFFSQVRFGILMGIAAVALPMLGGAWSEGANVLPVLLYGGPVWVLVAVVMWLDSVTWKKRLPFEVRGDEVISGTDKSGSDRVPFIGITVRIVLKSNDTHPAVQTTLQVLASKMNKFMKADIDSSFSEGQKWFVKHGLARGETTRAMWTTRKLEKWLRKEVRLLHQLAPVARVEVAAAYTGSSYWAPSSD